MSPSAWPRPLVLSCLLLAAAFAVPALTDSPRSKKYALLVGVRSYDHSKLSDLKYPENDAEELASVLQEGGYEVAVLTTTRGEKDAKKKPTKANIERELKRLLDRVTKHDVVLIGLAGHGVQYEVKDGNRKKDESFFCPSDAKLIDSDDFARLSATMLPFRELFKQLDDSGAGSRLLLIDACRNDPGSSRNADTDAMPRPARGTAALFACKGGERAFESDKLGKGHGVFFHYVLEGLRGQAKSEDGEVTWDDLTRYVRRQVARQVPKLIGEGARQTPHLMANVEGDPVLLKAGKAGAKDKAGKEPVVRGKGFTNSIRMQFARIPKGKFMMGSTANERESVFESLKGEEKGGMPAWLRAEGPRHEVEITKDFYLGVYEVTQAQYWVVLGKSPSRFASGGAGKDKVKGIGQSEQDDFPVESVSYEDAQAFVKRLNAMAAEKKFGVVYRLPTEAEWEYACRAGASGKRYHFGDDISDKDANYTGSGLDRPRKVGSYKPNAFGLYDMHGNVWEWCADWYSHEYYARSPSADPPGPKEGTYRVIRGGSWNDHGRNCRSAIRFLHGPSDGNGTLGFRVAASPRGE